MKKILLYIFLVPFIIAAQSTDTNDFLGKISLSVMMNEQSEILSATQKSKIESKIISLVSRYGVSGKGTSNFVINPRFEIYNEQKVEGMQNLIVLTVELNLFIKQSKANIIYATYNKQLQGTGYNRNEAIVNAISQINANDPAVKAFIEEGKQKIIAFYNSKCNDIIMEADKYAKTNNYEHSLAILMSVPVEATPCYEKINNKSIEIFKLYQKKQCQSQIQIAKTQIAAKQYQAALTSLTFVDPTSACFSEANKLIASAESKLTAEDKRLWDMEREKMKNKIEMEKYQIDAMKGVANSFLGIFGGGSSGGGGGSILGTIMNFLF